MKQYKKILEKIAGNKVLKKVTLLLCVFCVALSFTGISWSFFKGAVSGGPGKQVTAKTANLTILFTDSDVINVTDMFPGESVTKTFSVTNTGDRGVYYCLYFSDVVNTLGDTDDFEYIVEKSGHEDWYSAYSSFPTSSYNSDPYAIYCAYTSPGITDSYTLTINFKDDPSHNQDDNRGKTISAKLEVGEDGVASSLGSQYLIERIITESTNNGTVSSDGVVAIQQPDSTAVGAATEYKFTGSDPHNYIIINNELWRIVGVDSNELIKVVKDEPMDSKEWNTNRSLTWDNSSLADYLNGEYAEHINEGRICIFFQNPTSNTNTASSQYLAERNYEITLPDIKSFDGLRQKIGLLNPSDYAYASSACYNTNTTLSNYSNATCKNSNWLYNGENEWLLNGNSDDTSKVNYINSNGAVSSAAPSTKMKYRPVIYLDYNAYVVSGNGDSPETAYRIRHEEVLPAT